MPTFAKDEWINADCTIADTIGLMLFTMSTKAHGYPAEINPATGVDWTVEDWEQHLAKLTIFFSGYVNDREAGVEVDEAAFADAWIEVGAIFPHLWD